MFPTGSDAFVQTLKEIDALRPYLPQALSEAEVQEMIAQIKAAGAKDMGSIMKELQPQIKGRFDGKKASDMVKAAL